ncbi:MAG: gamma-glutamyltransferase, partial [Acidobacteriota bacterium]
MEIRIRQLLGLHLYVKSLSTQRPIGRERELVANEGPQAFYRGSIAQAILKTSQALGGVISAADLSQY